MNPSVITIGLDVGAHGGVAALDHTGAVVLAERMPTREVGGSTLTDGDELRALIVWLADQYPFFGLRVFIESCQSWSRDSPMTAFGLGGHYAVTLDAIPRSIEPRLVRAQDWQGAMLGPPPTIKDSKLRRKAIKAAALAEVERRWLGLEITPGQCRKPHEGIVDALLIAAFGLTGGLDAKGTAPRRRGGKRRAG